VAEGVRKLTRFGHLIKTILLAGLCVQLRGYRETLKPGVCQHVEKKAATSRNLTDSTTSSSRSKMRHSRREMSEKPLTSSCLWLTLKGQQDQSRWHGVMWEIPV